jgi:hypothetical protein
LVVVFVFPLAAGADAAGRDGAVAGPPLPPPPLLCAAALFKRGPIAQKSSNRMQHANLAGAYLNFPSFCELKTFASGAGFDDAESRSAKTGT